MEPNRPDEPAIEVMDTGREHSAFEQWAGSLLRRPAVRLVSLVGVALLVLGLWVAFSPDDEQAVAEGETGAAQAPSGPVGVVPPLGRHGQTSDWKVSRQVKVRSGPEGTDVVFSVVNRGTTPQDARVIHVMASFADHPALTYTSRCAGVELTGQGYTPLRGKVSPGDRVFMRCTDTTPYRGTPVRIDAKSVVVRTTPCHEEGGQPGV